jgi:DNA-binding CsgD family transcriptional regulator/tetratricopeptide (TPR) repeat protein
MPRGGQRTDVTTAGGTFSTARWGPLVGRAGTVATVHELLDAGERLISVVGPPGVGTSRVVAAVVAGRAEPVERVATGEPGGGAAVGATLLVVDDVDDVDVVRRVVIARLDAEPALRVVLAGDRRLNVRGERVVEVSPLGLPDVDALPDEVSTADAVVLFAQRAMAVAPGFVVDASNAAAVAAVCRAADGLPLALELAAAWVRVYPVEHLAAALDATLDLFGGGGPDLQARQRSLAGRLDLALSACAVEVRRLLEVVARFHGPADLRALDAVSGGGSSPDAVAAAVETHLARLVPSTSGPRLELAHSTRLHLRAAPCADEVRDRHRRWFLDRAAVFLGGLGGPTTEQIQEAWREDGPDVEAALAATVDAAELVEAIEVLAPQWRWSGSQAAGLAALQRAQRIVTDPRHEVRLMLVEGQMRGDLGDDVDSLRVLGTAYDRAVSTDDDVVVEVGAALLAAMIRKIDLMRFDEVAARVDASLTRSQAVAAASARLDEARGLAHHARGEFDDAVRHLDRAAQQFELLDDLARAAVARGAQAYVLASHAHFAEAERMIRRSVALAERLGAGNLLSAGALVDMAVVYVERRRLDQAVRLASRAVSLAEPTGRVFDIARFMKIEALALAEAGQSVAAARAFATSLRTLVASGSDSQTADGLLCLALAPEAVSGPVDLRLRLLAAAEAIAPGLVELSGPFWIERAAALRARGVAELGAETTARLAAEGAETDLTTAVDWARAHLRRAGPPTPTLPEPLSAREREVLVLVARGLTDRQIADRLVLGVRTVNTHVSRVLRKVGVRRRSEAAAWAHEHGLAA